MIYLTPHIKTINIHSKFFWYSNKNIFQIINTHATRTCITYYTPQSISSFLLKKSFLLRTCSGTSTLPTKDVLVLFIQYKNTHTTTTRSMSMYMYTYYYYPQYVQYTLTLLLFFFFYENTFLFYFIFLPIYIYIYNLYILYA